MEQGADGIVIVGGGIGGLATALALHRCVHFCSLSHHSYLSFFRYRVTLPGDSIADIGVYLYSTPNL
jgi:NADH dehydrogenase FAD-containing subunit